MMMCPFSEALNFDGDHCSIFEHLNLINTKFSNHLKRLSPQMKQQKTLSQIFVFATRADFGEKSRPNLQKCVSNLIHGFKAFKITSMLASGISRNIQHDLETRHPSK